MIVCDKIQYILFQFFFTKIQIIKLKQYTWNIIYILCFTMNPVVIKKVLPIEVTFLRNRKKFPFPKYKENPIKDHYEQTFENQKSFGKKISNMFEQDNSLYNVLAMAPTQSGKTGSMIAVVYEFSESFFKIT